MLFTFSNILVISINLSIGYIVCHFERYPYECFTAGNNTNSEPENIISFTNTHQRKSEEGEVILPTKRVFNYYWSFNKEFYTVFDILIFCSHLL